MALRPKFFSIPDHVAEAAGFPLPMHGRTHRDASGRVWTYRDDVPSNLGDLSGSWVAPTIGIAGSIGGSVVGGILASAGAGAIAGPIGAGIGIVVGLISSIFAKHAAKVQQEDQVTGAWAAQGPAAIDAVMGAYHSGQISGSDAASGLDMIEQQFIQLMQPVAKYNGKQGVFPSVDAPRPPNNCNAACGLRWDLHQQIIGLKAGLNMSQGAAGAGGILSSLGGATTASPLAIGALLFLGVMIFKR